MQNTNFGIQAIPAFALFWILAATLLPIQQYKNQIRFFFFKKIHFSIFLIAALVSLMLLSQQKSIALAFKKKKEIVATRTLYGSIMALEELAPTLQSFYSYHADLGDIHVSRKDFLKAKNEYLEVLKTTSHPNYLIKISQCYKNLRQYDSSIYYAKLAEQMQPYKLISKMNKLNIYMAIHDSVNVIHTAKQIIKTPEKVSSKKAIEIKNTARKILSNYEQ